MAGDVGARMAATLAPGGKMLTYGVLAGEFTCPVNTVDMFFKGTTLKGFWINNWLEVKTAQEKDAIWTELMELMAGDQLTTSVEATYDLADFAQALEHANRPGRNGKVLLTG